jgi:hypothetical protein
MTNVESERAVFSEENDAWFNQFLRDNYESLAGQYYALGDHEIVATAETDEELYAALQAKGNPCVIIGYCPKGTVIF